MELYLVRHAIAEVADPARWPDDALRPLTKKGERRFTKAARGLATLVPDVDVVLTSPYERARQTAEVLEDVAGWPAAIECPELASGTPNEVIAALQAWSGAGSIALVGHEPRLQRLGARLLVVDRPPFFELRKGAVARLDLPRIGFDVTARLVWLLPPRVLRALA